MADRRTADSPMADRRMASSSMADSPMADRRMADNPMADRRMAGSPMADSPRLIDARLIAPWLVVAWLVAPRLVLLVGELPYRANQTAPLKVHEIFPKSIAYSLKSYLPSLVTSCENIASNSERLMDKTRKFQIFMRPLQTFVNIPQLTSPTSR